MELSKTDIGRFCKETVFIWIADLEFCVQLSVLPIPEQTAVMETKERLIWHLIVTHKEDVDYYNQTRLVWETHNHRPVPNTQFRSMACWTTLEQGGVDPSQPWQDLGTEAVWTCEVFHRFQRGLKLFLSSQLAVMQSQHRGSEHSISHGSTIFSLFYYIRNWARKNSSRGISDFLFWMNQNARTLGVMNQEEAQRHPVLYRRRQKENMHSMSYLMQIHVSKLFLFLRS